MYIYRKPGKYFDWIIMLWIHLNKRFCQKNARYFCINLAMKLLQWKLEEMSHLAKKCFCLIFTKKLITQQCTFKISIYRLLYKLLHLYWYSMRCDTFDVVPTYYVPTTEFYNLCILWIILCTKWSFRYILLSIKISLFFSFFFHVLSLFCNDIREIIKTMGYLTPRNTLLSSQI